MVHLSEAEDHPLASVQEGQKLQAQWLWPVLRTRSSLRPNGSLLCQELITAQGDLTSCVDVWSCSVQEQLTQDSSGLLQDSES